MQLTYAIYRWVPLTVILLLFTVVMAACNKSYDDFMNR